MIRDHISAAVIRKDMIKALLLTAVAGALAHPHSHHGKGKGKGAEIVQPVINTCNSTCLLIEAYDFYGDGWDGVELHGEEEGGDAMAIAPDCVEKKVQMHYCPDHDGTYYFTAVHSNASYTPENYWEVFWTATSYNCDGSVANMYTGGFNSSLIMDYTGNEWSVQYWENLWDNEKKCDACGDAQKCKPKPKPKGKSKPKPKGGKPGKSGKPMDGSTKNTKNTTNSDGYGMSKNTTGTGKPKPRYGPPAVNLRVTMFDEEGDGWWMNDYSGASWYLADDRREKLFHTGTLCDGSVGSCNLCLGDGSYTMRFTGEASNFTAWDFCGVTGHPASELTFHVKKGKCYADSVVSLKTDCQGAVESWVSLTGVVAISGFSSEIVTEKSYSVLSKTLAAMIHGWSAENIKIVSTTLDSRSEYSTGVVTSRKLSDFTQDFTFEVSFPAEDAFGVDGRSYANVESLVSSLATTLSNKMSSGQFETALQLELALSNVVSLASTSTAELLSLEISTVAFSGVEPVIASTLSEVDYSSYETVLNKSVYNVKSIAAFFGVAVVGFVAFVGIMRQGFSQQSYDTLADDSERAADVNESEMETSTSPMVKAAFQVDATPTTSLKL